MRILLSNDDGINAPGLEVLERIARSLSQEVWVAAPETEQSGAGHSLTLHVPVRLRKISEQRFAISGTPTDAVLLGVQEAMPKGVRPALLLSGVNRGSNVAEDVTYSGTVAAAMEGTMLGIPSIALSQLYDDPEHIHWQTAEYFAPGIITQLMNAGWPSNTLINLNFPDCAVESIKGIRVCPQGKRTMGVSYSERVDPKGRPYFWIGGGERDNISETPNTDLDFLHQGYITITPLCLDLTDYAAMEILCQLYGGR